MPACLTRLLQLAQQWRQTGVHALRLCQQTLAKVAHRVSNTVRHYAPIIWQSGIGYARNAWQHTLRLSRICFNHAVQFTHRIMFMALSLGIRIAEFLRHNIPVFRQFLVSYSVQAWQSTLNLCRFCSERTASLLRRTMLLITTAWKNITARVRHGTPLVLHDISSRIQDASRETGGVCRGLLLHTINVARTMIRGILNACAIVIRFIHGNARRLAHAVTATCRRAVALVQDCYPIFLQTAGRGLQVTAHALNSFSRSCLRWIESTVRVITGAVLATLALSEKIIRSLLFVARSYITSSRVTGRYLGLGSLRLFRASRTIAIRASERLYQYVLLTRLNKPIGIFLLLWPALWALLIAKGGAPDFPILLIFIAGVVLMRSAGCIINDLADRDFDAHVSRTRLRPLATGKVTPKEALVVAGVLLLCAFLLVLQLNALTIGLSVIGALLAIIYPFTKRYTYMPQFFLGLTFGWAVPMAFAAQTGTVPAMGWILLMATVLWALVYDTMYAMVDRDEDIKLGIKSTAILFEDADRIIIGIIQLLVVLTLLLIGSRLQFNGYYYACLAIAALLFVYQQYLIRERIPAQCFNAFLNNNWFGAIVFGGILMNYQFG